MITIDIPMAVHRIKTLLQSQGLAVLATEGSRGPYCNLVAFVPSEDLKSLYFATTRSTRKFNNLSREARVSLLVDNRRNAPEDLHKAVAVTALGTVRECPAAERETALSLYIKRHPYLSEFVTSPSGAFLKVSVETYLFVWAFQNVMEVHFDETTAGPSQ